MFAIPRLTLIATLLGMVGCGGTSPATGDGGSMDASGDASTTCPPGPCEVVLAAQDFEMLPDTPTWTFTGPVIFNEGLSPATANPPSSPLGIGGSRAWETTSNSEGLTLEFATVAVPVGTTRVRLRFRLAAMNLTGDGGGPDNNEYVLVALSVDGGVFYDRVRIRGGTDDNTTWAYDATGVALADAMPMTETLFQPVGTGLRTADGYSTVEIVFPAATATIAARITARSSASGDTWLVDDVELIAEYE